MEYKLKVVNAKNTLCTEITVNNTMSLMSIYFLVYDILKFDDYKDMQRYFRAGDKAYIRSDLDLFDVGLTQEGQVLEIDFAEVKK